MSNNAGQPSIPKGATASLPVGVAANGGLQQQLAASASSQQSVALVPGTSGTANENGGLLYDLSSFDPLQAHALQLTASAGLTNLLNHPSTVAASMHTGDTNAQVHAQQTQQVQVQGQAIQQTQQSTIPQSQQTQQAVPHQQAAYYYIQPSTGTTNALQPIAPAPHAGVAAAIPTQTSQPGFVLPAGTPAAALAAVPAPYQQQILPNTIAATAAAPQAVLPNFLMTRHLQAAVPGATHQPAPLAPAIAPSRKRDIDEQNPTDQRIMKKQRELAPSVVSSSTHSTHNSSAMNAANGALNQLDKPPQEASQVDIDKMTPAERRRYERNLREQQRSYKISQQIKELRDVLSESNVPFKPNKYSILLSVVEYIKQLQARAIMLDAEHQKLINTIRQTNEMVSTGNSPSSNDETNPMKNSSGVGNEAEMLFVQGLDYRSVFDQCPAALGIAALDGRILECNPEFQLLLGYPKEDLLKQSLFNLVRNHQDIFRAMADMLKGAEDQGNSDAAVPDSKLPFWSGAVISKIDGKLSMNLTLTLGDDGTPKFFNCALTTAA